MDKPSKLDKVLEGFKPISMGKLRYPRLKLSEDFINSFHREIDRLTEEGQNPKNLLERVGKALQFHVNEDRTYHKLDEEKAKNVEEDCAHRDRGETGISDQELEARRKPRPQEDADRKEHERKRAAGELSWQKKNVKPGKGDHPKASETHKIEHK